MSEKSTREKTLATTYIELHRYEQNGEYERALKAANRILHMAPTEVQAFHCKIVCLIHQSKFEEALQNIQKFTESTENLNFEKAYCQYRLNKLQDALITIQNTEEPDLRTKELHSQVLYRLERFDEALEVYKDIIKNTHDDYADERETNLGAVIAQIKNQTNQKQINTMRENTYELCYNKACILLSQELYTEAEKKLAQCEKLCQESLDDDGASEEELEVELALIKIQLAYVYQKQGRIKEAQQLYSSCLKLKLDDSALVAVANNNMVVINKDQNVFDSKKKMRNATNDVLINKLPSRQRKFIALNNSIFLYYTNQYEQCRKVCSNIEQQWPELTPEARIMHALCISKSDSANKAVEYLRDYMKTTKEKQLHLQLTCVHLLLMQGDRQGACNILESLEDKYKPGIVGALITLYLAMGNETTALNVFTETVHWYQTKNVKQGDLTDMWRQAADFHLKSGHPNVAASSLEELLKINPEDKRTLSQLIIAYSQFNKQKSIELSLQLPTVKELSDGVDLNTLENSTWSATKKTVTKVESSPGTPRVEVVLKRKKNRKRKAKLPKDYDPNIPADPERWLPKYERAGYRKKRDRKAKEIIKGSQGISSGQADQ